MANQSSTKYVSLSLLLLPPLFFALAFFAQFPATPRGLQIHPSLTSLPPDSRSRTIYPEDLYEGGSYVELPFGKVRYWLLGPRDGDKIVMIHGLSVPAIIWKDIAPVLAEKGFRVLVYDLYGRGYSDAPQKTYDASLYTMQLALLMQHLKWEKAHVVGFSMGGAITAAFATSFPSLCTGKVVLISSAGIMDSLDMSRTSRFMSSPLVQFFASSSLVRTYMQRPPSKQPPSNVLREIVQLQSAFLPGYNHALASSIRDGPIRGELSSFRKLASSYHDVLLISGTGDRTVPYKYATQLQSLMPNNSRLLTIENGPHDLPWVHPETVREALIYFFRGRSAKDVIV